MRRLFRVALVGIAFAWSAMVTTVEGPNAYRMFLRDMVGPSVQVVVASRGNDTWYGTGFNIRAPSGKVYMITNRHVCDHFITQQFTLGNRATGQRQGTNMVAESEDSDLCLLEPMLNAPALNLAGSLEIGEQIATLGHPSLVPLTLSFGEALGVEERSFTSRKADRGEIKAKKCRWKNSRLELVGPEDDQEYACIYRYRSLILTAKVLKGASGSPVVNRYGNVVGVVNMVDRNGWGYAVPLTQVREFLRDK